MKIPDTDRNPRLDRPDPLPDELGQVPDAADDGAGRDRHPWLAGSHRWLSGRPDETALATRLLPLLRLGMLVLLDRGFDAGWFFATINRTGARLLCQDRACRSPRALA